MTTVTFDNTYLFPSALAGDDVTKSTLEAIVDSGIPTSIAYDRINQKYKICLWGIPLATASLSGLFAPMDGGGAGAGGAYTSAFNGALMTIKVNFKVLQSAVYPGIAGMCGSFANVRLKKHVVGAYLYNDGAYKIYLYTFSSAAVYSQSASSVTISLNTDYWIELGANGTNWTLKVFSDAAKTVQVGSTLTVTSDAEVSKLAPAFSFLYSNVNPNGSFDLFSVESAQMGTITYENDCTWPADADVLSTAPAWYENGVSHTGSATAGGGAPIVGSSIVRGH